MYNMIGLGGAGCNIAEKFENLDKFTVKLIDSDIEGDSNCISIPKYSSHEEYENKFPILNELKDINGNLYLILAGSGNISGGALKLLQQLQRCKINILYIRPDLDLLSNVEKLQEKVTFNVFQQYARSGLFEDILLVDNLELEKILGDVPLIQFNESLNNLLFSSFSNLLHFNNSECLIDASIKKQDFSRISTIGIYDLENNIEKLFFNLDYIDTKMYYISIPNDRLTKDVNLRKIIRENMKQKVNDITKIGYKIFSHTNSDKIYSYVLANSRMVQV